MNDILILLLLTCLISIAGCQSGGSESDLVEFERISKGADSALSDQQILVIRNDEQMRKFWAAHTARMSPVPDMPEVDFSADIVVAAILGLTPAENCGGVLDINEVRRDHGSIVIDIAIKVPYQTINCIVSSFSFELIKFHRWDGYIGFNVDVSEYDL